MLLTQNVVEEVAVIVIRLKSLVQSWSTLERKVIYVLMLVNRLGTWLTT